MPMNAFIPSLTVSDIHRSTQFYEDALGFTKTFAIPGPGGDPVHVSLSNGTAMVMLGVAMTDSPAPRASDSAGLGVNLYVGVEGTDDIDDLFARATAAGARVVQEPTDEFWGDRDWSIADPDGYVITVGKQTRILSPEEMIKASKELIPT